MKLYPFHATDQQLTEFAERGDTESPALRKHLAACAKCRDRIAFMRDLAAVAPSLDGPEAGNDLKQRIHQRIANGDRVLLPSIEGPLTPRRISWLSVGAVAAVLVAMIGGGLMLERDTHGSTPRVLEPTVSTAQVVQPKPTQSVAVQPTAPSQPAATSQRPAHRATPSEAPTVSPSFVAVSPPPGTRAAILATPNPKITVIWLY